MKNKFLPFAMLFICACSTLPTSYKDKSLNTLIQKPEFNYKISYLPKLINIYFFYEEEKGTIPQEIQGFISNSYFYNKKISYRPKLLLSPLKTTECNIKNSKEDLIIVFNLSKNAANRTQLDCIKGLPKTKTLYVSNFENDLGFNNNFIVSREEEKSKLIEQIMDSTIRFVVIDSKNSTDKENIKRLLEKNKKEVLDIKTYEDGYSSQDLFMEVLMVNRSNERLRRISRRIGQNIVGESRPREDLDSFFFSVSLHEARNLKPALDYLSDKDFDIFILNSWETNDTYKLIDKDMNGSFHSDFPIMMPIDMPKHIADDKKSREFAIGYDTFEIILLKYGGINLNNYTYKGLSGEINPQSDKILRSAHVFKIANDVIEVL